jgi:hypothetical protein
LDSTLALPCRYKKQQQQQQQQQQQEQQEQEAVSNWSGHQFPTNKHLATGMGRLCMCCSLQMPPVGQKEFKCIGKTARTTHAADVRRVLLFQGCAVKCYAIG